MKIAIASDHGGFELKENLIKHYKDAKTPLIDLGTNGSDACDYSDIANILVDKILSKEVELGILICGTGIGISIAANRHKGIRAAIIYNDFVAKSSREHNNANIMVFGGRTMLLNDVIRYIEIFKNTKYEGGRHDRRIEKLDV